MNDFQSIIIQLQDFWNAKGCLIWQPYHNEVGAGTMNPATTLRVLGPEPWNVAYVEPSIRPDDGRYGQNPNRFYQHIQYQVILKPAPANSQEVYLESLVALGIDPARHDIRFVEDNWESPVTGAWGLGWEVWLDGLEITQFTYFQQSGGQTLDPISLELTYGMERIAMALQGVRDFRDLQWNQERTYGDVYLSNEQESSKYAFELADVGRLRQLFDLYEAESNVCLEHGQVIPAHDYMLKCSHTFNVLDTRGAIGVTERAGFFRRMRRLSRLVAEAYVEQRRQLEFPWLGDQESGDQESGDQESGDQVSGDQESGDQESGDQGSGKDTSKTDRLIPDRLIPDKLIPGRLIPDRLIPDYLIPDTFLLEIGTEEIPHTDLEEAMRQLRQNVPAMLKELRLEHGKIQVMATPRRLTVHVEDLAPAQSDLEELVKGPPAARAFDTDGNPTQAAEGFARSKGIDVSDLEVKEFDGGEYVAAVVKQDGRPAADVLIEALPKLISDLRILKTMRWNATNVAFSRPIRWLLALHGETVIPFEYAGLTAGDATRGLRFNQAENLPVSNAADYFETIQAQGIILDPAERQASIEKQIHALAGQAGGQIPEDPGLLLEVTHLVEAPAALLGQFDPSHLELPTEALISVMKKHQRYFPMQKSPTPGPSPAGGGESPDVGQLAQRGPGPSPAGGGELLPYFITVANKAAGEYPEVVRGNEAVIRARFADAAYFVRQDMQKKLADFVPALEKLTFQTELGSMGAKARRIETLVGALAPKLELTPAETSAATRAAQLCKADLATQMVVEMTSLQGVMGRDYALHSGEPQAVAVAIFEHYLPRSADDISPKTKPGLIVGLADRLDSLAGLFAAGLAPSGNKDPFALRRAALGLVGNLIEWHLSLDLQAALGLAASNLPIAASPASQEECLTFVVERLRNIFLDQGYAHDVVDAIVSAQGHNPALAAQAVRELVAWVGREDWATILPAYSRCVRITRTADRGRQTADGGQRAVVSDQLFEHEAEAILYAALQEAEDALDARRPTPDAFLTALLPMIPAIDRFFEEVLVMAEDEGVRVNRLALLQRVADMAAGVADMSKLEGF